MQNGLPGILGDKIDDESIAGSFSVGTGDFYFMFAVKMNSSISYCGFECIGTSSNAASFEVTSTTNARWNSTNFTSSTFAVNTAYVLEVFRESGVVKLIRNGVQNATTIADANNYGTAKSINIWRGQGNLGNMYMLEFLYKNGSVPSDTEKENLRSYVNARWAIY